MLNFFGSLSSPGSIAQPDPFHQSKAQVVLPNSTGIRLAFAEQDSGAGGGIGVRD